METVTLSNELTISQWGNNQWIKKPYYLSNLINKYILINRILRKKVHILWNMLNWVILAWMYLGFVSAV